ncbi:hypothetical protein RM531_05755 [Salinisphaera sp. P385]|uniref:PE-PGRS family protein n=1 Tax=Spectribacter acetivorans TaxID=3075603 RepID=A0ABU3B7A8_9GAMM|nr:hypothetical protein [Salinisphaera sp. P385]MDT0617970.1 hypothetical protein [Salinisphaera sp. P385]
MKKQLFAGAAVLAFAGGATAADPVGNFLAGLDGAAVNLDSTLDALVVGNSSGTANGLTALVTEFSTTVATDTAGEDLAIMGADLGNQLNATGQQFLYPLLDQLTMPGAEPLAPFAQFYLDSGALAQGIPFVRSNGSVTIFEAAGASSLEAFGFPASTLADLIGPGGQLSTALGDILAGGVPGGEGFGLPIPGMEDGAGLPGADILLGFLPGGDGEMSSGIPGADILLGFLPVGGDMASGLGPDALLALLPIPGGEGSEGGLPGADILLGLIPGADGSASAEGGLPGLDTLLVLIPMGEDGSPLGMLPLGPDALLGLLSSFSLPGMNGA